MTATRVHVCQACGTRWTLTLNRGSKPMPWHRANQLELPVGDMPGPWIADGLCAQTDPEIFHPEKGGTGRDAKAVCARCPVINPCRDWAVATQQQHGIWGGLNRRERAALAGEPTSEAVA